MLDYIEATGGRLSLFDAPLQGNFHKASNEGNNYDLCTIFDGTLVQAKPGLAVTLVENHDTQPLQSLEQPVQAWFRPLAYALILLRADGYPCVFYTDLYGAKYKDKGGDGEDHKVTLDRVDEMETLLSARKTLAYGEQKDYFDHQNCIGWTRTGDSEHPGSGCAVLISNSEAGTKNMEIGKEFSGKIFVDYLAKEETELKIDENGWANFKVNAGSVSVWGIKS
jgi:alpha-amylase